MKLWTRKIYENSGIAAPFMPNFWLYTACRAVIGLGIPGLYNGIFTLLFETLDTEKRSDYYILIIQGWSSAVLFTALFGYLFPDFRHYEIAMGIATIPVVLGMHSCNILLIFSIRCSLCPVLNSTYKGDRV